MNDTIAQMQSLSETLDQATELYDMGRPIMSDAEWDSLYFKLMQLEKESGTVLPDSPTQKVVYRVVSKLQKVIHSHPMLSLDKTKDIEEVQNFIHSGANEEVLAMCKMDGLTCSLHYDHGILQRAETRGNGEVGEDVTHNARVLPSIPQIIDYTEPLTVDGEIICTYKDFEPFQEEYKNPRNFAAGSIRLLDSAECGSRSLSFVAWDLIGSENKFETLSQCLAFLGDLGFTIVPNHMVNIGHEAEVIDLLKNEAASIYPIDGIVFKFNSRQYYQSLGATNHHFRGGIAFKFYDETYPTTLKNIEWTMGRTGVLTPVAVFSKVDIDGSEVERASLHNVSIMQDLLGTYPRCGQKIYIYKANMIIPQVYSSEKVETDIVDQFTLPIPSTCPICGAPTALEVSNDTTNLLCTNENCEGKLINRLDHFCGKKGLDIKGLSKITLDKLISWGWVDSPVSIFYLTDHEKEWKTKPGFGEKSVNNILAAIEAARTTTLEQFLSALGIPLIGRTYAKKLCEYFETYEDFRNAIVDGFDFTSIEGFGPQMHEAICSFDYYYGDRLYDMKFIIIKDNQASSPSGKDFEGLVFVITGKLKTFKNRDQITEVITNRGGRVASSVTSKTNYLINNDVNSNSTKNQTAKKLGVKIISEEDFLNL